MSNHKERRKEKLKERQTLVDVSSSNEGQSKFIKALGSNDYITREKVRAWDISTCELSALPPTPAPKFSRRMSLKVL